MNKIIKKSRLEQFKEDDKVICASFPAMMRVYSTESYREAGFNSWTEYYQSRGISYIKGYRITTLFEVQKSIPDIEIKSEAVSVELNKIKNIPQRRAIAESALEESGSLSVKAVKSVIDKMFSEEKRDNTGIKIPTPLLEFWNRNEEVQFLVTSIHRVRRTLEFALENSDKLYAKVDKQGLISQLKMISEELESAKSYAVCPTCNGVLKDQCEHCACRGTLSKFHWSLVPEEIKELREI